MKPWPQTSPMTAPKSRPFSRASARCSKNTEKRSRAMKHSVDKILTTHAGSLPRPEDWLQMMQEREKGDAVDAGAYAKRNRQAVSDIVKKQLELGIDVIDDGEQGKPSFLTYVNERLGGFEVSTERRSPWQGSREVK